MRTSKTIILLLATVFHLSTLQSKGLSHSGRTNSSGCHNNWQTGGYHCHNSGTGGSNYRRTYSYPSSPNNTNSNYGQSNSVRVNRRCSIANRTPDDATNLLSDRFFYSLHPELKGRSIRSDRSAYKTEWLAIHNFVSNNLVYNFPVSSFIGSKVGLTDTIFYSLHPELKGRKIKRYERDLKHEWLHIYNRLRC